MQSFHGQLGLSVLDRLDNLLAEPRPVIQRLGAEELKEGKQFLYIVLQGVTTPSVCKDSSHGGDHLLGWAFYGQKVGSATL